MAGDAATLATVTAAVMATRRADPAARWLAHHAGRSRWRRRLAIGLAGLARHRLGPRRGAAALAASTLSVLAEAGLLAAAFEVAGTPVPWRGLLLACAAGQLGVVEGGVLGALALTGTHPATALPRPPDRHSGGIPAGASTGPGRPPPLLAGLLAAGAGRAADVRAGRRGQVPPRRPAWVTVAK